MSKLREAAKGVLDAYFADEQWLTPYWDALRDALAEDRLLEMQALTEIEYSKWGRE